MNDLRIRSHRDPNLNARTYRAELPAPIRNEFDMGADATAVEAWYDRSTRNWIAYLVDADGAQVGPAQFSYSKDEAMDNMRYLARQESYSW